MHGTIFFELKKYVETRLGPDTWSALVREAGLGVRTYEVMADYPDGEALTLAVAASRMTGIPVVAILEDFGEFLVPDLLRMYAGLIDPSWKTLDVIEQTENQIHRVVRMHNREAHPPELKCVRQSVDEVVIHYSSSRKMCSVAKGIARGLARHYRETIEICESTCMLKGDSFCNIVIKRVQTAPPLP